MKKVLLLSFLMCFGLFVLAQKNYQLKPGIKVANMEINKQNATKPDPAVDNQNITAVKHIQHPKAPAGTSIVNVVDLGSAANIYTYGYSNGAATFTWYNKDINTVSNLHRMGGAVGPGGQYSGDLAYDFSTDGGMTWTNQVKIYTSDISGGSYNLDAARYPQGAIYNPPGNTDPDNAYMVFHAATMDASNGDPWGSYGYGTGRFGDPSDTSKHLNTSDLDNGFYQGIPTAFEVTQVDGNSWMADASLLDSYTEYLGNIIFMKGVFNEGIGDMEYDRFLVPADASYARYLKMAFDRTGQIGYVYWNDVNGALPDLADWWYPLLIKTTDAGETWSDVIAVQLGGVDGIPAIKNYLSDEMIAAMWTEPLPTRDEIMYTSLWANSDIAVDAWGNPHLATVVFICGPGLDPGYIFTGPQTMAAFDIYSNDANNTNWQAVELSPIETYTGDFLDPSPGGSPLTEYNRIQVSATTDGTKMFFTWMDTRIPDVTTNTSPDIYAKGFDLMTNKVTHDTSSTSYYGETNVTTYSEAMWQAYFLSSSRYVIDEGSEGSMTYTIPMVYADMDPQDVLQPVLFKYIQDFSYADGDFTDTTGNAPIYTGINEHHISAITNVSQNYPNPFNRTSTVVVTLKTNSNLSLIVTNMIGQKVMQMDKGQVNAGSYTFTIDAGNLPNGVYFYSVMAGKDKTTNKMIVE
jgi:hypothetical protein